MRVKIRFQCVDIPTYRGNLEIDVPEGTTVEQAVVEYAKLHQMEDTLGKLPDSIFFIGKKFVQHGTVLHDMDELAVMRILAGG